VDFLLQRDKPLRCPAAEWVVKAPAFGMAAADTQTLNCIGIPRGRVSGDADRIGLWQVENPMASSTRER